MPFGSLVSLGSKNLVRLAWDRLARLPLGRLAFSRAVGRAAPYTSTIGAVVERLERGRAEVVLQDRPAVRNHLDCVHAIALANLAELAGNLAVSYSMPDDARFIVAGMSIDYVKKARGTIRATAVAPVPETSERVEYEVPVEMRDPGGTLVAKATLRTLVGPKKKR
jgi:uncharacterized protein (TIGR00369 family)